MLLFNGISPFPILLRRQIFLCSRIRCLALVMGAELYQFIFLQLQ